MSGLFGTFHIATRGLFAQQSAIDTTSHNIANANTEGYSRQRVTLQTSRPFPMPSLNNAVGPGQFGTGVDVASVDRIRDSFLDYQVRVEEGVNGQFTGRDKFLSQIENIINEPSDSGMSNLIGKFFDSWNTLATSANKSNAKSIVAQQSLALANDLNHSYTELESIKKDTQTVIKDSVFNINSMLDQLNQVNQQIVQVKVGGNNPNDLMDKRDLLLDQLSGKFGITISKRAFDGYDVTTSNEAKYGDASDNGTAPTGPNGVLNIVQSVNLGSADNSCRFSYVSTITNSNGEEKFNGKGTYTVKYYKNGDMTTEDNAVTIKVNINSEDQFKKLNESRVLWSNNNGVALKADANGKVASLKDADNLNKADTTLEVDFENLALFKPPTGELKGYMSVQQDIDTYEGQLNKFAKALAFSVNSILSQSSDPKVDSANDVNNFFVNAEEDKKGTYQGTDTAAITTAEQNITAANITVNSLILKDDGYMKIKTAATYDSAGNPTSGESDGSRALAIEMLRDSLMSIQNIDSTTTKKSFLKDGTTNSIFVQNSKVSNLYTIKNDVGGMTLDSYFKDTVDRLGIQEQEARRMVDNQAKLLSSFKESRDAVSGVSLDEEMANLVQFQHCYQANAKIISTVDQLLEVVINGLRR